MKYSITTKFGVFEVSPNGDKTTIFKDSNKVCDVFIQWWDKDKIVKYIESHKELFDNVDVMSFIDRTNVKEVLQRVNEVLGKEEKGFYSSRIKQCINRLK